jgi:glycosyltransferase involved in cell wall biosynthesis
MRCDWQAASRRFIMEHAARGNPEAAHILRGLLASERMHGNQTGGAVVRVAVGVCTAERPLMLRHCLEAIGAQLLWQRTELHVVVVDNEAEPNSRRVVEQFAAHCPFQVHYTHEPRRGIPQARNAVLAKCRELDVDWIAFTDDDCWVSPTWLEDLLEASARHKADVVYGRRELLFPLPSPYWAARRERARYEEGQCLPYASTHNVLFAAWLVHNSPAAGLAFDERLVHGEDTDFFHRAALRGARIVYSREPIVLETVAPERATLNYQAKRAYQYGISRSKFHRRHHGVAGAVRDLAGRCLLQAPLAVARLITAPLVWPFSVPAFKVLVLKGTARLAGTVGAAAGLLGFAGNPYYTIDGY